MAVATKPAGGAAVHDETEMLISGSEAVAEALTLADIDVVTAYPIRPYDTVMQAIAKKIANGKLVAEYIVAEGEHSQFEIVKHASTVGARVFCGSSGVGWMYAMEAITVTPALCASRWWRWWGTGRSTIPARSASSTTTRCRCATWAGSSCGSTPPRRRSTRR